MTEQNTGWRDIKTDPPLEGAKVLLLAGDFVFSGLVCDGEAVASGSPFGTTVWDASHWQPLPPPPGEEDVSTKPEKANTSPECVKSLDLCYVMQHALLAGQMGIRWENYDPTECSAYHRLTALQARCDKLEAAARDLLDNAEPKWGDKVVVHRSVIEALRSVVDGGE